MPPLVSSEVGSDGVAVVTINHPPMNALAPPGEPHCNKQLAHACFIERGGFFLREMPRTSDLRSRPTQCSRSCFARWRAFRRTPQ